MTATEPISVSPLIDFTVDFGDPDGWDYDAEVEISNPQVEVLPEGPPHEMTVEATFEVSATLTALVTDRSSPSLNGLGFDAYYIVDESPYDYTIDGDPVNLLYEISIATPGELSPNSPTPFSDDRKVSWTLDSGDANRLAEVIERDPPDYWVVTAGIEGLFCDRGYYRSRVIGVVDRAGYPLAISRWSESGECTFDRDACFPCRVAAVLESTRP